jgi:hypothetical protein
MKIYCDMDGVLVNLVGGIVKASQNSLNKNMINEILSMDFSWRKDHPDPDMNKALDEIKILLSDNASFWADSLDPLEDAMALWEYISKYDVDILSHPWDQSSLEGKEFWVYNHLEPRPANVHLPLDGRKELWATDEDGNPNILIDDFHKYISKWESAGGIAIIHTSAEDTIKQLKEIL